MWRLWTLTVNSFFFFIILNLRRSEPFFSNIMFYHRFPIRSYKISVCDTPRLPFNFFIIHMEMWQYKIVFYFIFFLGYLLFGDLTVLNLHKFVFGFLGDVTGRKSNDEYDINAQINKIYSDAVIEKIKKKITTFAS